LVVYHKNKEQTLHRLSEVKCSLPFSSLPFDFVKSSMAMFITELLVKTLREEEQNEVLFRFLSDSILELENSTVHYENFHLMFMVKLAFYLGFGSETAIEIEEQLTQSLYPIPLDDTAQEALQMFILAPYTHPYTLDRLRRNQILDALVFFYKINLEDMGDIRSLEVLREMMR
jgi:DNA repair protein RecO (recombination protein O)